MVVARLTYAVGLSTVGFLILSLSSVEAADTLCTRGNITVFSSASHQVIASPDKCFPVPVVDRNQFNSVPSIRMSIEQPGRKRSYTVVMVEGNNTVNRYDLFWLESNLTIDATHLLVRNLSLPRDVRNIIEYRPPKSSQHNLTYFIMVYFQPFPRVLPPGPGPFLPRNWAPLYHLQLIGVAEFKVRGMNQSPPIQPAHHQPLPPAIIPLPAGTPPYPHQQPPAPQPTINTYTYNRNYTNSSYPRPYNPIPHPQPAPYYPPNQPPPYYPPNQPHYPSSGNHRPRGKGAATDLHATSSLIILIAFAVLTLFS